MNCYDDARAQTNSTPLGVWLLGDAQHALNPHLKKIQPTPNECRGGLNDCIKYSPARTTYTRENASNPSAR